MKSMYKVSDERMGELKSLTEAHQETAEEYNEYCDGFAERRAFNDQSEEAEQKFEERSTEAYALVSLGRRMR